MVLYSHLTHLDFHLHKPGICISWQPVGNHTSISYQAPGLLSYRLLRHPARELVVERRHGGQQDVGDVPSDLVR